jgi:hypothetical protein
VSASFGWPKLSVTLPERWSQLFPLEWGMCESCGAEGELFTKELVVWQEQSDTDRPTPVAVVLCPKCSKALVPPHPRLYRSVWPNAPLPGVMELCRGCRKRAGYRCTHPDLTTNGGPGLETIYPAPSRAHLNYGGGRGEWVLLWNGPPTSCAGRLPHDE